MTFHASSFPRRCQLQQQDQEHWRQRLPSYKQQVPAKLCNVIVSAAAPDTELATSAERSTHAQGGTQEWREGAAAADHKVPRVPSHWEDQMRKAPMGKRRVLQR